MLTICRTSSVRNSMPVLLKSIPRRSFQHHEPSNRTIWTTSPRRHESPAGAQHNHAFSTQTPSHPATSSTLLTSLTNQYSLHDTTNSTPIQYAPDSPAPTSYAIPAATFADAKAKGSFWSYTMYKHTTTGKPPLRHYCKTSAQTETVAKLFIADGAKHLGFDMEWAPAGRPYVNEGARVKANVSMIQLASESRIAIFHLALHTETTPLTLLPPTSSLFHLLTSPHITKLGVAISADMTRLTKYFPYLMPRSHFELSHLYKTILYHNPNTNAHNTNTHTNTNPHPEYNKRLVSLQEQTSTIFKLPLSKDQDIRGSDWSRKVRVEQVEYAASDAYVGVMLFGEMDRRRRGMVPCPRMPAFVEFRSALGEWPGEKERKRGKQGGMSKVVGGEVDGKQVIEEEVEEGMGDEEEGAVIGSEEQHSSKTLDAEEIEEQHDLETKTLHTEEMEEEDFTDARDDAFRNEDMTTKKTKTSTSTEQGMKKRKLPIPKTSTKNERTPDKKAAALMRRNAWLQNMYQQKLRK